MASTAFRQVSSSFKRPLRTFHTGNAHPSAPVARPGRKRLGYVSGGAVLGGTAIYALQPGSGVDAATPLTVPVPRVQPPTIRDLVRAFSVYSLCSIPTIVDWSPTILDTLLAIPGVSTLASAFVRVSFFDQFVGGDTVEDTIPILKKLRAEGKAAMLQYSVEVDARAAAEGKSVEQPYKQIVNEMLHCIDVAGQFEDGLQRVGPSRKTYVSIKLTALLPDAQALTNLSVYLLKTRPQDKIPFPGRARSTDLDVILKPNGSLSEEDARALAELYADLSAICERGKLRGVRVMIDAEHTWYQPAIDAYALAMMKSFNALPSKNLFSSGSSRPPEPVVYTTYQAVLRRTFRHLERSLADASKENYALGIKLVRGAYQSLEVASHGHTPPSIAPARSLPPVFLEKQDTDCQYNACVSLVLGSMKRGEHVAALFGTHNTVSCDRVLDGLVNSGLAVKDGEGRVRVSREVAGRVTIAQLYGMREALSNSLVARTVSPPDCPLVLKCLPYGALVEVMPYLGRRAVENKSVLGGGAATEERRAAWRELWARLRLFEL